MERAWHVLLPATATNPVAGCLPILLQMPVWIALYPIRAGCYSSSSCSGPVAWTLE